ncbi:uncharacterized protein DUF1566 [Desulfobotulus alkaliphilus]|uniref:Uncharacterized protein DUF1566 n=1 Tax=Desulfobotulus alkaliphilus TaxID=622671 RepID=A0A562RRK5_9BACT|nr:DUF1566 domain-containing protein [Desulfobotulus alkaliphilus]TWI71739.1 uncharacterized protein DUF1566 [Desulfobotulus alkaliphilus]
MKKFILIFIPLLLFVFSGCSDSNKKHNEMNEEKDIIADRYINNKDGSVTDRETGLQWMRCSLGQSWDGNTCLGDTQKYSWDEANKAATDHFFADKNWRLPTIEELDSLVSCSSGRRDFFKKTSSGEPYGGNCQGDFLKPSINTKAFPNTMDSWYWSSSSNMEDENYAWNLSFYYGSIESSYKTNELHVRLVRIEPVTSKYIKLDENGQQLPESASSWSCIKDNDTGLIWEKKTENGGLTDLNNTYTWFNPNPEVNGGFEGYPDRGSCTESGCDTRAYVEAVNNKGLCGAHDWRIPTIEELNTLVYCSSGEREAWPPGQWGGKCMGDHQKPTIDSAYFPSTPEWSWFWSSSPSANNSDLVWGIDFDNGSGNYSSKGKSNHIRLVRSEISGSRYTKLDDNGNPLPDSATSWSCVQDNEKGIIWEEKSKDEGLRYFNNTYSWFNPVAESNGGFEGYQNKGNCTGSACDTHAYAEAINSKGLCGAHDWRIPTIEELNTLVYCGPGDRDTWHPGQWSGKCMGDYQKPTINSDYFPNTPEWSWFWSSSPSANYSNLVWGVHFGNGYIDYNGKNRSEHVRLLRSKN